MTTPSLDERRRRVAELRAQVAALSHEVAAAELARMVGRPEGEHAFRATVKEWWRELSCQRFAVRSHSRDPTEQRRAVDLGLSLEVLTYGLHRLEGTGRTLEDLPLGKLMAEAGYGPRDDVLPYEGSWLNL